VRVATDRGVSGLSDSASGPAIGIEGEMAAELARLGLHHVSDPPHSLSTAATRNSHAVVQKNGASCYSGRRPRYAYGAGDSQRRPEVHSHGET